jgi:hypothetical protein
MLGKISWRVKVTDFLKKEMAVISGKIEKVINDALNKFESENIDVADAARVVVSINNHIMSQHLAALKVIMKEDDYKKMRIWLDTVRDNNIKVMEKDLKKIMENQEVKH